MIESFGLTSVGSEPVQIQRPEPFPSPLCGPIAPLSNNLCPLMILVSRTYPVHIYFHGGDIPQLFTYIQTILNKSYEYYQNRLRSGILPKPAFDSLVFPRIVRWMGEMLE